MPCFILKYTVGNKGAWRAFQRALSRLREHLRNTPIPKSYFAIARIDGVGNVRRGPPIWTSQRPSDVVGFLRFLLFLRNMHLAWVYGEAAWLSDINLPGSLPRPPGNYRNVDALARERDAEALVFEAPTITHSVLNIGNC